MEEVEEVEELRPRFSQVVAPIRLKDLAFSIYPSTDKAASFLCVVV